MVQTGALPCAAVVGLGLMGGSMALAMKRAGMTVIGIDRDEAVLTQALATGAIDAVGDEAALKAVQLVVLAVAPRTAIKVLKELAVKLSPATVVTDLCGVKRSVVAACAPICAAHGLRFVGAHPMAGKERSGFAHAEATLFEGASFILTPTADTDDEAVAMIKRVAKAIGCARVTVTSPEEHDRMIAFTSQLPHVLAGCYVQSPCSARHKGFSAGSYRDVSRVATVDEMLWSELFAENRDVLANEIEQLIARLADYRSAILSGDEAHLTRMIREGRLCKLRADEETNTTTIEE